MDSDSDDIESGLIKGNDSDDGDFDDIVKNNNLRRWKREEPPLLQYAILVLILVPKLALLYSRFYAASTVSADFVSLYLSFRLFSYATFLRDVTWHAICEQMVICVMTLLYLFVTKSSEPFRYPEASDIFLVMWLAVLILKISKLYHRSNIRSAY
ncbi:putative period circadian protein [Corchorus capsularis]|uniref:Putative period circadian protein n=1 Tax=Corchorus capsularis TaxID=210143 RepID=A0A1R3G9Z5_COCAP|nr:putative period circadian protein [Corchorus capsularis]